MTNPVANEAAATDADVAILGGGVIGLSIAFHLLQAAPGLRVAIVDAGAVSGGDRGQASYAAAGMLAPFAEAHGAGPFVRLGVESLDRYPAFIDAVRDAAGTDGDPLLAITGPGILRVARTPEEAARLDALFAWQRESDYGIARLTGDEARALEPSLAADVLLALHSPREQQIDPRRLTHTLRAACRRLGATFLTPSLSPGYPLGAPSLPVVPPSREGSACSSGIRSLSEDAIDIRLPLPCKELATGREGAPRGYPGDREGVRNSGCLVIAGGAWSRAIACDLGIHLPVKPIKGQILALCPPQAEATSPLRHTIYAPNVYLVPRPNGRIVVGATEEPDAGFNTEVQPEAWSPLLDAARSLVPALRNAPLDGWPWAGLRPATPDGLPILGALPGQPNVFVATGHFRNGILLAPITGEIIAHQILHPSQPHPLLDPAFRPERFAL